MQKCEQSSDLKVWLRNDLFIAISANAWNPKIQKLLYKVHTLDLCTLFHIYVATIKISKGHYYAETIWTMIYEQRNDSLKSVFE